MMMENKSNKSEMDEVRSEISKRRSLISNRQYVQNVIIITIQWTVASFSFYLLMFMNKYYEGSIFINYYLDGIAGVIGTIIAKLIIGCARMKISYIISLSVTLLGSVFLLLFQ